MLMHVVVDIPDDEIVDNRLESTTSYLSLSEGKVTQKEITGYIEPYNPIDTDTVQLLAESVHPESVILFRYPGDLDPEDAVLVKDILKSEFPDNKVLGLTSDIELLVQSPTEAVDMLNRMIAHIKIVS